MLVTPRVKPGCDIDRTNLDIPPSKMEQDIVINEWAGNSPKQGMLAPPKGGNGKGKKPMSMVSEHNSGSEGESFEFKVAFTKKDDDQTLHSRLVEIHVRIIPDSLRAPAAAPPITNIVNAPIPTMVAAP